MKKSLFLLSLISVALTACSSNNDTATNNGVEVVDASTAWQTDLPSAPMPNEMSTYPNNGGYSVQPSYEQPAYQPTYNQPTYTQPSYEQPSYSAPAQPAKPKTTKKASSYATHSETVGQCQVVRNEEGKPIYAQIPKGCFTGSQYTVGKQDTLFLIGYLTGTGADHIANLNQLDPAAKLPVGKVLRVR